MGVPPFSMEIPKRSILIDLGRIQVPERLPFQFQTVMYLAYSYKRYVSFPPGGNLNAAAQFGHIVIGGGVYPRLLM